VVVSGVTTYQSSRSAVWPVCAVAGGCVSDWATDGSVGACPRVWADEGEGEREAAG